MQIDFSLVIPLWNEGKNIDKLIAMLANSQISEFGMHEVIFVNNASTDNTPNLIENASERYGWIKAIHLRENQNYGGGVYEGCKYARSNIVGYIPGDLQVSAEDVIKVWKEYQVIAQQQNSYKNIFVKGHRTIRHDPIQTKITSRVYTTLSNIILGLKIKDLNGLPKIFDKSLLNLVPLERMKNFVFDAQLLSLARKHKWIIKEVPVTFHARREGISSWSNKRIQTYMDSFKNLLKLVKLRNEPGITLPFLEDGPKKKLANFK